MVTTRTAGRWVTWRVGRQRLAWRPVLRAQWRDPAYSYHPAGPREAESQDLLSFAGAVLATLVVWPWRAVRNRWPVVAYLPDAADGDIRMHRAGPMPRAEARAVAREWVEHIKEHGAPPARYAVR